MCGIACFRKVWKLHFILSQNYGEKQTYVTCGILYKKNSFKLNFFLELLHSNLKLTTTKILYYLT